MRKPQYHLLVSVIGPSGDCTNGADKETAGPRLSELVGALDRAATYLPSCSGNLAEALILFAERIAEGHFPSCIAARDVDPNRAGLQADCTVEERIAQPDGTIQRTALPSCDQASPPAGASTPLPVASTARP